MKYDVAALDFNRRLIRCKSACNMSKSRAMEHAQHVLRDPHVWYVWVDSIDGTHHREYTIHDIA